MKLYYHPVSTVSCPVVLFALDSGIALDYRLVDLATGGHLQPAYEAFYGMVKARKDVAFVTI
jgi:glutathione S-transferase